MSTTTEQPSHPSRSHRSRLAFRHWRWRRPFWAGLLTLLAGLPIGYFPYAHMTFGELTIRMATTAGAGSLVISGLLIVLGLTMWFQPHSRIFAGVAAILLALVSLVVSNVGGFLVGFLLAMAGGGMSIAWVPGGSDSEADREDRLEEARRERERIMRDPVEPTVGTGSALEGFTGIRTELGKGKHRVE